MYSSGSALQWLKRGGGTAPACRHVNQAVLVVLCLSGHLNRSPTGEDLPPKKVEDLEAAGFTLGVMSSTEVQRIFFSRSHTGRLVTKTRSHPEAVNTDACAHEKIGVRARARGRAHCTLHCGVSPHAHRGFARCPCPTALCLGPHCASSGHLTTCSHL